MDSTLICDLGAIAPSEREAHLVTTRALLESATGISELPDGYAVSWPAEAGIIRDVAAFIANERLCCAFLRFEMLLEPGDRPLWLKLTGGEGVKEFLQIELELGS